MSLRLSAATATDLGLHRDNNEDALYAGQHLLVVADGVGGQPAGEVASELVITSLRPLDAEQVDDPLPVLRDAVESANRRIAEAATTNEAHGGMATTVTALLLSGDRAALVHIGDSRAYRLRDGELQQLTTDHTYVQWLVDRGMLQPEEARHHPQRSVVTKVAQGEEIELQADVLPVREGDRFLLCSDGLSDVVDDAAIRDVLADTAAASEVTEHLVALALRGGGPDNISVVVADPVPAADLVAAPGPEKEPSDPGEASATTPEPPAEPVEPEPADAAGTVAPEPAQKL